VQSRFHAGYLEKPDVSVVRRNLRRTEWWPSWAAVTKGIGRLRVELLKRKGENKYQGTNKKRANGRMELLTRGKVMDLAVELGNWR